MCYYNIFYYLFKSIEQLIYLISLKLFVKKFAPVYFYIFMFFSHVL